jgi:hypothetical protein
MENLLYMLPVEIDYLDSDMISVYNLAAVKIPR